MASSCCWAASGPDTRRVKSLITHGAATTVTRAEGDQQHHGGGGHGRDGVVGLPGLAGAQLLDHHRHEDRREHPPEHQLVEDVGHGVGDVVGVGQAGLGDPQGVDEGGQPAEAGDPGQRRPHRHDRRRPAQGRGQDRGPVTEQLTLVRPGRGGPGGLVGHRRRRLVRGRPPPGRPAVVVERVTGIEPAWPAWKAGALPLSYTRAMVWSGRGDLNPRPPAPKAGALPLRHSPVEPLCR